LLSAQLAKEKKAEETKYREKKGGQGEGLLNLEVTPFSLGWVLYGSSLDKNTTTSRERCHHYESTVRRATETSRSPAAWNYAIRRWSLLAAGGGSNAKQTGHAKPRANFKLYELKLPQPTTTKKSGADQAWLNP